MVKLVAMFARKRLVQMMEHEYGLLESLAEIKGSSFIFLHLPIRFHHQL